MTPEATVSLEWSKLVDIDFPLPKAEVTLHEDGYKCSVQRIGHGQMRVISFKDTIPYDPSQ